MVKLVGKLLCYADCSGAYKSVLHTAIHAHPHITQTTRRQVQTSHFRDISKLCILHHVGAQGFELPMDPEELRRIQLEKKQERNERKRKDLEHAAMIAQITAQVRGRDGIVVAC